jgi:ribosome recycling factor
MTDLKKKANTEMAKVVDHLKSLFKGVAAGRADPDLLNTIRVECYGSKSPVSQIAAVSVLDFQTLQVQPFDASINTNIAKALSLSNLNFKVEKTKSSVLCKLPQLTGEARKKLVKHVESLTEQQKIALRKVRQNMRSDLLRQKHELPKDEMKSIEKTLDKITKDFTKQLDDLLAAKRKSLLTK